MAEKNKTKLWLVLERIARLRVAVGFFVALVAFLLAEPSWHSVVVGIAIASCGESLRVWAAGHIRKGQEVTTSGPYSLTRHPLYLGSFVIGVGFVWAAGSAVVAILVASYLLVMLWVATTVEEAALRESFGTEYDRYRRGQFERSRRRFSLSQVMQNGEHRTLIGFILVLGLLLLKVWLSAGS